MGRTKLESSVEGFSRSYLHDLSFSLNASYCSFMPRISFCEAEAKLGYRYEIAVLRVIYCVILE